MITCRVGVAGIEARCEGSTLGRDRCAGRRSAHKGFDAAAAAQFHQILTHRPCGVSHPSMAAKDSDRRIGSNLHQCLSVSWSHSSV